MSRDGRPTGTGVLCVMYPMDGLTLGAFNRRVAGPVDHDRLLASLAPEFAAYDAERKFGLADVHADESPLCRAGDVLRGRIKPRQCPAFGSTCTPEHPLGAPMVSSEGACAAYYNFGRFHAAQPQEV